IPGRNLSGLTAPDRASGAQAATRDGDAFAIDNGSTEETPMVLPSRNLNLDGVPGLSGSSRAGDAFAIDAGSTEQTPMVLPSRNLNLDGVPGLASHEATAATRGASTFAIDN